MGWAAAFEQLAKGVCLITVNLVSQYSLEEAINQNLYGHIEKISVLCLSCFIGDP